MKRDGVPTALFTVALNLAGSLSPNTELFLESLPLLSRLQWEGELLLMEQCSLREMEAT